MTKFITLFKQMWLQKLKYVYLAFIINIFLIIFISAFATISHDYDLYFFYSPEKNLNSFWASNFATITLYVDLAWNFSLGISKRNVGYSSYGTMLILISLA